MATYDPDARLTIDEIRFPPVPLRTWPALPSGHDLHVTMAAEGRAVSANRAVVCPHHLRLGDAQPVDPEVSGVARNGVMRGQQVEPRVNKPEIGVCNATVIEADDECVPEPGRVGITRDREGIRG